MQAWSRVAKLARPEDPEVLTNLRRAAIVRLGFTQLAMRNLEEAQAHLRTVADSSPPNETPATAPSIRRRH